MAATQPGQAVELPQLGVEMSNSNPLCHTATVEPETAAAPTAQKEVDENGEETWAQSCARLYDDFKKWRVENALLVALGLCLIQAGDIVGDVLEYNDVMTNSKMHVDIAVCPPPPGGRAVPGAGSG